MNEISNEVFCELSQDELLNVAGGRNELACATCTGAGAMLFSNCVSIGIVLCPPAGIAAGVLGAALFGTGIYSAY